MQLNDFHFDLPQCLIASYPLAQRSSSRLLCLSEENQVITHQQFNAILTLVNEGDLLVFNDTKVIPARLMGRKQTGGQIEILVERILGEQRILAQIRASKSPRVGESLILTHASGETVSLTIVAKNDRFYELDYPNPSLSILSLIEAIGEIPLPHYMNRAADESDKERYQTVYAKYKGSVAAPTAGFHFDEALLAKLREKKVDMGFLTLHIGAGTFSPVRAEKIEEHQMHAEYLEVSPALCEKIACAKARGKRVIAVGTTSMRALETASQTGEMQPYQGETSIFIYPGYIFHCVDAVITNLHLPCSSLLMLVCAFGGHQEVMHAYQEAVKQAYRFYSYGDAMWLEKK